MKKCPICKRDIYGTAKWHYRYRMCKSCAYKLKREGKISKYDIWIKKRIK